MFFRVGSRPSSRSLPPLPSILLFSQMPHKSLSFECTTDGMEERSRASPGKAEETVAALAGVLLMTPVNSFQFWPLGALSARRCAQAATKSPVTVAPAAARAAPRRVSPLALLLASTNDTRTRRHVMGECVNAKRLESGHEGEARARLDLSAIRAPRRSDMTNTAGKLGPRTQMDRGTCPGMVL
jgi:hypothetical protein